jgi:hypothetical protein
MPTFYQNYLATRKTADVTSGKPIAVWSQSISDVSAINPLVAFYGIHGRKREVLLFFLARTPHEAFITIIYFNAYTYIHKYVCMFVCLMSTLLGNGVGANDCKRSRDQRLIFTTLMVPSEALDF